VPKVDEELPTLPTSGPFGKSKSLKGRKVKGAAAKAEPMDDGERCVNVRARMERRHRTALRLITTQQQPTPAVPATIEWRNHA
jgi:hypothetical protein